MPDHPAQLRARALGDRLRERVLVGGRVHADLDQLVVVERRVDGRQHGVRGAALTDLNDRIQRVSLGPQVAALEALQGGSTGFTHRGHSTGSRTRGPLLAVMTALVAWLSVACATTAPPEPVAFVPVPRAAEAPLTQPSGALEALADADPISLLDPAPPESESLLFVREVLERKAAKLGATEREGVARALVVAEAEHGLPVVYTLALITQESRFDPRAKGPTGSLGLMQLQPVTAREVARRHGLTWQSDRTLLDPVQNVRLGLAYLAELRATFGSTDHAMAAYNIGPGNLRRLLAKRPLRHGPYLKKVHAHAEAMRGEFVVPEIAIGG